MTHVEALARRIPHGVSPLIWHACMAWGRWSLAHETDAHERQETWHRTLWEESTPRPNLKRLLGTVRPMRRS